MSPAWRGLLGLVPVRRSDRLVAGAVLGALALVWLILLGFDALGAFAGEADDIGQGDYTAGAALTRVLYTLPRRAYEIFPTAAVIACLLGLGGLAATSELTALRAAGLSRLRICLAAIGAIAVLTALMMLVAETVGPWGEQRAQALAVSAKSPDLAVARWSGLWAREGDTFLNAQHGRVVGDGPEGHIELTGMRLYELEPDGRLRSLALVERAVHRGGEWTLFGVRRSTFHARHVASETIAEERWDSRLRPELLSQSLKRPRYLAASDLRANIDYLERNQLDPSEFAVAYWARWFYPLNVLVLCLAAMPFAFGTLRDGGFGKRVFIGIVFGIGFFLLQRIAVDLAAVYRLDPRLGQALPALLVGLGAWLWFGRRPGIGAH
jgi:lipopolysaccharide export system permease protein